MPVFVPAVLFTTGEMAIFPILPASAQLFGADLPMAGFVAGLGLLGQLCFDIPAAALVKRFGERNSMIGAALTAALGIVIAALATTLLMLGLGIFIAGAMAAIFGLARHGYMAETVPLPIRARSLSMLGGMFRLGAFLGPLLGAAVVATLGVGATYWMSAALCLSAALLLLTTRSESMKDTPVSLAGTALAVAKREWRSLATLGVGSAILGMLRTTRLIGLPLFGLYLHLHPAEISLYVGLAGGLDFALFYFSGSVMDKHGRRWAAIPTLLALFVGQVVLSFAMDSTAFLVAALLLSLANGFSSGIVMTIGADMAPAASRSEYLASFRLLVDTGTAVTPPLISVLTIMASLPAAMVTLGGVSLVGAYLMWKHLPNRPIQRD